MGLVLERYIKDDKEKTLYNYYAAKKIYFVSTPTRFILLEKNNSSMNTEVSLTKRNTCVRTKENGILLFPKEK